MTCSTRHSHLAFVVIVMLTYPSVTTAAVKDWNALSGNWATAGNWSPSGVPGAGDDAQIMPADGMDRTVTYDYTGAAITLNALRVDLTNYGVDEATTLMMSANTLTATAEAVGLYGRGVFTQSGGTHTVGAGDLYLGYDAAADGTYNLSDTGTLNVNGYEYVGYDGTGTINQSGGTNTIGTGKFLDLGVFDSGATGTYNLSGGSLTTPILYVGDFGTGHFNQTGGTVQSDFGLILGFNGGTGDYTLSGGSLTSSGAEYIGSNAPATFTQSSGTHTVNNSLQLGLSGGTSIYNLSGDGALNVSNMTEVGVFGGTGMFSQSGGSSAFSKLYVGRITSMGMYELAAGSQSATYLVVGSGGTGTFNQSGGASVIGGDPGGLPALTIGRISGGVGTYTQTDGSLTAIANSAEYVGEGGIGSFIQSGGTNNLVGSSPLYVGYNAGSVGSYTLSDTGSLSVGGHEYLGYDGTGTFDQSGGVHNVAGYLYLGYHANSTGSYTQSGGALIVGVNLAVGFLSNGTFDLSAGSATVGGSCVLGSGAGSTGVLNVSGTGELTANVGLIVSAPSGNALNLSGGRINTKALNLAGGPEQFNWTAGTLNITSDVTWDSAAGIATTEAALGASRTIGADQTLMVTGNEGSGGAGAFFLTLDDGGTHYVTGTLTLNPTGTITQNDGSTLYAATFVQAGGTVNGTLQNQGQFTYQSGLFNGRLWNQGTVSLGPSFTAADGVENDGAITLAAGQTLVANGSGLDNRGTFTLAGGALSGDGPVLNNYGGTFQAHGTINPALTNNGLLTIDGQLAFNGGFTNYGTVRGSGTFTGDFTNAGLVTLDGGTLAGNINPIDNTGTIQGAGSLNARVVNTGVIRASGGQLSLGSPNNSNEVGGLVQAADGNTVMFLQGLVTNAGSISLTGGALDNNNHALSNTGIVNGYGIVRTGGLTSTGAINIGGGDLDVFGNVTNNGTVAIQGARSAYFYGDVDGAGNYTGAGTAVYLAGFSPGNSPAAVSFAGNAVLATTSTLNIELGGTDPGAEYDQLLVSGALSLGGFLNVSLTGGFTPAANQSFDILDWGTLSGAFNTIQLPDLSGGLEWNTSQLYTTGVLSVASPGLLGDYNQNGIVDAADYVVWRKNEGTNNVLPNDSIGGTIGHAQYDEWRAQFGQTTSSGSIASAPVPEPSSIRVLAIVCCGLFARRRFVPRNPRRPLRAA